MVNSDVGRILTISEDIAKGLAETPFSVAGPQFVDSARYHGEPVPRSVIERARRIRMHPGYNPIEPHRTGIAAFI